MSVRSLSAIVLTTAGAALIGGAVALAPSGQAAPATDTPTCIAERTCALLTPATSPRYLPLVPASSQSFAPLGPAAYAPLTRAVYAPPAPGV